MYVRMIALRFPLKSRFFPNVLSVVVTEIENGKPPLISLNLSDGTEETFWLDKYRMEIEQAW